MPVHPCTQNGKPGFKFGTNGKCYTYSKGGAKQAKLKAFAQGYAITQSQKRKGKTPEKLSFKK